MSFREFRAPVFDVEPQKGERAWLERNAIENGSRSADARADARAVSKRENRVFPAKRRQRDD